MFHVILSACLLLVTFPDFSFSWFAWIAFVPIFFLARNPLSFKTAFGYFYLLGCIFFLVTVEWLRHVSYFGWLFVSFLYATYFGCFGLLVRWFWVRRGLVFFFLLVPSAWVVLEWIRTEIPMWAFGWNLLAYSQSDHRAIANIASLGGVYYVSWLVMLGNVSVFFLVSSWRMKQNKRFALVSVIFFLVMLLVPVFWTREPHVAAHLPQASSDDTGLSAIGGEQENRARNRVHVAVVQGNIAQGEKWDINQKKRILQTYHELSRFVAADRPDLILWPEASFPGYFNIDESRFETLNLVQELHIPILVGGLTYESESVAFNSAYWVTEDGKVQSRYDKVRLVPFGEYVPWKTFFGFLGLNRLAQSLGVGDYSAGADVRVFSLKEGGAFSPLICFEDTFPSLARRAVAKGAQFLVVITNDAWFSKSAAPYQHLQASIFRAIENGVPVVRASNTGVSAFINARGKVLGRVQDQQGNSLFIGGGLARSIEISKLETFYQRFGYLFPAACFLAVLVGLILTPETKSQPA